MSPRLPTFAKNKSAKVGHRPFYRNRPPMKKLRYDVPFRMKRVLTPSAFLPASSESPGLTP